MNFVHLTFHFLMIAFFRQKLQTGNTKNPLSIKEDFYANKLKN